MESIMVARTHTDTIAVERLTKARKADLACEDRVAERTDRMHPRQRLTCGGIRCRDDSPRRHARAHAEDAGRDVVPSGPPRRVRRIDASDGTPGRRGMGRAVRRSRERVSLNVGYRLVVASGTSVRP
ncbi:hypothetical protein [Jannaschia sp. LMIT008]|uniref:hypothetical protein n=1 Tax=Jannaschia maritima TaxID=3032585 RepID=UPI0028128B18|nr:hypothetical protein [Jannaschia sp. LMIT008]